MKTFSRFKICFSLETQDKCIEYIVLTLDFDDYIQPYDAPISMSGVSHVIKAYIGYNNTFGLRVHSIFKNSEFLNYIKDNYTIQNFGSPQAKIFKIYGPKYFSEEEINSFQSILNMIADYSNIKLEHTSNKQVSVTFSTNDPMIELQLISLITTILDRYEQREHGRETGDPG
jgi:hypothetical protein